MCGIVAMLSRGAPVDGAALRRATEALRHRGPDGLRTWVSDDGRVGLGHTRLAINDPAAAQPIVSESSGTRIVANGEFYDFDALRRELEGRGDRFRTRSDSEVALHLYGRDGVRCLDRLRGEFAFVVWDERNGTLFAPRDRFGIKPLFVAEFDGVLCLASEAKALFAAGLAPAWDDESLFHTLHACPLEARSLFAGIRQIPPGHYLIATEGATRVQRYWDLRAPRRTAANVVVGQEECVERVRALLDEVVRLRLRADVPVGCLLSGGLDSSAVLGFAAAHSASPVTAFTIAFDGAEYDESATAADTARDLGARHVVVPATDEALADHFAQAVWHAEMVQYNAHGTARFLLSREIQRAGYKAVMAGEGSDELFFGYQFLRAALPRRRTGSRLLRWLRLARRLMRSPGAAHPQLAAVSPWLARIGTLIDAPPTFFTRLEGGLGFLRSVLDPDFVRRFQGHDPYRSLYRRCDAEAGVSAWEPARQLGYLWFRSIFPNYHLAADRLDMAHAVEVRLPFLDHVLVEYAYSLPLSLFADVTPEKLVLREAARPFIPDAIYHRAKQPFWAPPSSVTAGSRLSELTQDVLRGQEASAVAFLDPRAVVRLLDATRTVDARSRGSLDALLLMLTSACLLNEAMRRSYSPATATLATEASAIPHSSFVGGDA